MNSALFLDVATHADVADLASMREEQGWHANAGLLEATLAWSGGRHVVLRQRADLWQPPHSVVSVESTGGGIVAAAFALAASEMGVIGNVLVRPGWQRGGLGRRVMEAALAWQRECGVRSVLLDATVAGQPLYRRLGFTPIGARSWSAHGRAADLALGRLCMRASGLRAGAHQAMELDRLAELDAAAFGADRIALLAGILTRTSVWLYTVDDRAGAPLGYLFVRLEEAGGPVLRVGPWVAQTPAAGAALLAALLEPGAPWRAAQAATADDPQLVAALPGYAPDALMLWHLAGGECEVDDVIMQLDFGPDAGIAPAGGRQRPCAAHPEWCYAWLSSMTF